jgi:acyl-CoA synthetase (AMP-forming)/AMP-acid ligase II
MTLNTNLVDFLQYRADRQSDRTAYIFLKEGVTESGSLTYQELDRQARAIAAELQSLVKNGSRALLVYPYDAGLEFIAAFFGCLYAGVIAVTIVPPRYSQAMSQLSPRAIASGAEVILTTSGFRSNISDSISYDPDLVAQMNRFKWIETNNLDYSIASSWVKPNIEANDLAFLQFTSGSTGMPKGVMVTHKNILYNEEIIRLGFAHQEDTLVVGWLPMFHDMGLIGNVLQPFYLGTTSVLMSPMSLIQQPFEWLQAISKYKATTSGAPNFAYDLLCVKATPEKLEGLDFSNWRVAYSGAETVRAETIDRFSQIFAPCGFRASAFYPCYGMAEATLYITGGIAAEAPEIKYVDGSQLEQNRVVEVTEKTLSTKAIVSCGRTWLDTQVMIVDPETRTKCSGDRVGEIWIAGSGVAKGYWEQPEETKETYQGYLADTGEGPFLRSGDLGFMNNGELYVTGRLKEVMIFWGRYCYPQHVEQTVENSHPALRPNCGAAFAIEVGTTERLVIAQEVERNYLRDLDVEEVVRAICESVGREHEVEVYAIALLKTSGMLKTSSGKIQRRACKAKFLEGSLSTVAIWQQSTATEKAVTEMVNLAD